MVSNDSNKMEILQTMQLPRLFSLLLLLNCWLTYGVYATPTKPPHSSSNKKKRSSSFEEEDHYEEYSQDYNGEEEEHQPNHNDLLKTNWGGNNLTFPSYSGSRSKFVQFVREHKGIVLSHAGTLYEEDGANCATLRLDFAKTFEQSRVFHEYVDSLLVHFNQTASQTLNQRMKIRYQMAIKYIQAVADKESQKMQANFNLAFDRHVSKMETQNEIHSRKSRAIPIYIVIGIIIIAYQHERIGNWLFGDNEASAVVEEDTTTLEMTIFFILAKVERELAEERRNMLDAATLAIDALFINRKMTRQLFSSEEHMNAFIRSMMSPDDYTGSIYEMDPEASLRLAHIIPQGRRGRYELETFVCFPIISKMAKFDLYNARALGGIFDSTFMKPRMPSRIVIRHGVENVRNETYVIKDVSSCTYIGRDTFCPELVPLADDCSLYGTTGCRFDFINIDHYRDRKTKIFTKAYKLGKVFLIATTARTMKLDFIGENGPMTKIIRIENPTFAIQLPNTTAITIAGRKIMGMEVVSDGVNLFVPHPLYALSNFSAEAKRLLDEQLPLAATFKPSDLVTGGLAKQMGGVTKNVGFLTRTVNAVEKTITDIRTTIYNAVLTIAIVALLLLLLIALGKYLLFRLLTGQFSIGFGSASKAREEMKNFIAAVRQKADSTEVDFRDFCNKTKDQFGRSKTLFHQLEHLSYRKIIPRLTRNKMNNDMIKKHLHPLLQAAGRPGMTKEEAALSEVDEIKEPSHFTERLKSMVRKQLAKTNRDWNNATERHHNRHRNSNSEKTTRTKFIIDKVPTAPALKEDYTPPPAYPGGDEDLTGTAMVSIVHQPTKVNVRSEDDESTTPDPSHHHSKRANRKDRSVQKRQNRPPSSILRHRHRPTSRHRSNRRRGATPMNDHTPMSSATEFDPITDAATDATDNEEIY